MFVSAITTSIITNLSYIVEFQTFDQNDFPLIEKI